MPRPKKKVILFIVEGYSDQAALERPIQVMLQGNLEGIEPVFLTASTDVTSDIRNTPTNILNKLNHYYFEPFFSANDFYYPKDVLEVIHICDLDGTFIPDEFCKAFDDTHKSANGFVYDSSFIYGQTREDVIDRNHRKAENLRFLLEQDYIKVKSRTTPYSIYFFSSNIDHYLYDKLNLSGRDKAFLAETFADKCDDNPELFIERICRHNQALKELSYTESWNYIMQGNNSIKRHTNFNIFLQRLLEQIKG